MCYQHKVTEILGEAMNAIPSCIRLHYAHEMRHQNQLELNHTHFPAFLAVFLFYHEISLAPYGI